MNGNITILVAFWGVLFLMVFFFMGLISFDTFMAFWEQAFVVAIKAAVFATIPYGFILGILARVN